MLFFFQFDHIIILQKSVSPVIGELCWGHCFSSWLRGSHGTYRWHTDQALPPDKVAIPRAFVDHREISFPQLTPYSNISSLRTPARSPDYELWETGTAPELNTQEKRCCLIRIGSLALIFITSHPACMFKKKNWGFCLILQKKPLYRTKWFSYFFFPEGVNIICLQVFYWFFWLICLQGKKMTVNKIEDEAGLLSWPNKSFMDLWLDFCRCRFDGGNCVQGLIWPKPPGATGHILQCLSNLEKRKPG